jgi:hypothetical protein
VASISGAKKAPGLHKTKAKTLEKLLRRGFGAGADFGGRAEAFVIGVFDSDANVDGTSREAKRVVGVGVSGHPEVAEKIFAIGCEVRETIFAVFRDDVRDSFAVGFYDLEIVVINPDTAFEVALLFLDDFGSDVEDVGREVVNFLTAEIGDVVFDEFIGGEREGLDFFQVVQVFLGHLNFCKRVGWGIGDLFKALPCRRKENVALDFVVAIGDVVGVEGLHLEILRPCVRAEKLLEGFFFGGEFLDDLIGRKRRRLFGDGRIFYFACDWLGFDGTRRTRCRTRGWRGRERASGLGSEGCGEEERGERKRVTGESEGIQKA